jgi:2-polyprenyl-3-methyl-5-hydroxy-6-metoxy-1,4-benzoquinol methylase
VAAVPVTVVAGTLDALDAGEPFDAAVCSLVLCSVGDPEAVLHQVLSLLRP